jgi:hypothetical protein
MALQYDTSTSSSTTGTSLTFAHTCSGGLRVLFVAVDTNTADNTDYVTGVTYAGVAMTRVDTFHSQGLGGTYFYMLVNPTLGANNVVISTSGSVAIYGTSASYMGMRQTGQPNVANGNALDPVSTLSVSVTTTKNDCWLISCVGKKNGSGATLSAGTGTTSRQILSFSGIGDSNGTKTPAGSYSQAWNIDSATGLAVIVVAIEAEPDGMLVGSEI